MNTSIKNNRMNSIILFTMLISSILGCGKSNPGTTPVDTTKTTPVNTDPVQYGTPFASVPATKDIVMYEVNLRTYSPTTLVKASARLDSIKALGVNVVWLMPTYPIGVLKASGSPYAVRDYTGVNADFGTLDDLRAYIAKAHSLGMAVILDWVANHTSWDNAWIQNKSWYQQDAAGNIIIPPGTNYTDVAALNYNNTTMRSAMIKAMKYWIYAANIDGYRCDFADNIPNDFWVQALDTLNTIKTHKLIYLAEGTKGPEISASFQMGYAFSYYGTLKSLFAGGSAPSALFSTNSAEIASLPSPGIKLRYITNHDNASSDGSTLTEYNGKQGALAAFVLASYMGGVPLIYGSQEVGYPNSINFFNNVNVDYTANPDMVAAYKKILAFRAAHEAVKTGTLTQYPDANVVAFEKKSGSDDVVVLVNAKNSAVTYSVPAGLQSTSWTDGLTNTSVTLNTQLTLQPYQYLILKK
ncbi:alpha-amylase family glycosyl hydrolase [Mucilaginibacter flavus]|uniref:alpha-amylase family glycosyl hydrolase n=1 Tax=Mucilaginibacter flavus TaxID=931504 RepID=UPI0025B28C3A|nr:alpha-amylase family glycosyl hydrolase [Mucilaginibacter flavus]MDN3582130.1 alpha-amylase family glycosyl hydrolase [Mucilaginibacter flavus]